MLRPLSGRSLVGACGVLDDRRLILAAGSGRAAFGAGRGGIPPDAPSVVSAVFDAMHHFPEVLPDVAGPELAGLAIEAEFPDISEADAVHLGRPAGIRFRTHGRVVGRNAVGFLAGRMVDVDPQDRREPVGRVLAAASWVVGRATVSERDVEKTVRPESDRAAVVVFKRIFLETQIFSSLRGSASRGSPFDALESRNDRTPLAPVIGRIVNEEVLVVLVLGVEGHAQQALFVAPVDPVGKLQEGLFGAGRRAVGNE